MEAYRLKKRFPAWEIAKINLRHNGIFSISAAAILCLITPVLIGTASLDQRDAALVLEMFLSLTGAIVLTPTFQPEQNEEIDDLVSSKYHSVIRIYLVRAVYSVLATGLLITAFSLYMAARGCVITPVLVLGTVADAVFLGSLGMLTAALSHNTVIGYLPPFLYYALNIGMGPKLGVFYLFSMTLEQYTPKLWMFAAGVLLIAISLLYQKLRRLL